MSVGDNPELVATGIGSTKKEAKQKAADNLLKVLGIDQKKIREAENEVKKVCAHFMAIALMGNILYLIVKLFPNLI